MEVPALTKRAWVTTYGLTAQELHAVNGYSGWISFPTSIDPYNAIIIDWVDLYVADGIIRESYSN